MRWKLVAGNVLALLFATVASLLWVRSSVTDALSKDIGPMVERSVLLFDALRTAQADRYQGLVNGQANSDAARNVFAGTTETARSQAAFEFAQSVGRAVGESYPKDRPRPADVVAITDEQGKVLARNVDPRQEVGRDLKNEFEAVAQALRSGQTVHDYVRYDGTRWFDTVFSPIVREGQVLGLLVVGYELADSLAAQDKQTLGAEVGYIVREGDHFAMQSLSFGTQTEKSAIIAWANANNIGATLNTDASLPVREIEMNGHRYLIAGRAVPGLHRPSRPGAVRPGYLVLMDVTAAQAPALGIVLPILYLGLLALVFMVVFNVLVANSILQPIEVIEEGLLKIINGDQSHRIELQHPELGGIVYRINQLVQTLTGEEESDESGRISRPPAGRSAQ
jgi:HAMP domain-containing protein/PAS domain-containing protein